MEAREALLIELWESFAVTTKYLLLKGEKYVAPSK